VINGTGAALLPAGKFLEDVLGRYRETTDFDCHRDGAIQFPVGSSTRRSLAPFTAHYFPNYPVSLAASVVSMNANRRSSERELRF
jgi:hypothetical protein